MKKPLYFVILFSFTLQSCLSIIAKKYELNSKSPKLEKINIEGKEVYFLGMAHLAKKEFYDNTRLIAQDLQSKGFVFYIESVTELNKKTAIDTIAVKKIRKIIGLDLAIKYSNSQNPYLQKLKKKYDLIDQPKYDFFNLSNFKRVDYSYTQLVEFYEKKHGEIILDTCDINSLIGTQYGCQTYSNSERNNFTNEIIFDRRNSLIADSIIKSADKKIVIIYGKMHLEGIKKNIKN